MALKKIPAPDGPQTKGALSGDTPPPRYIVMDVLKLARERLGLKASVLATLDCMLSFLPPKRSHHVVFASNRTLCDRIGGLTDRTLRRHVTLLIDAGLLRRRDSGNKKRFRKPAKGGQVLFGLDLSPLFERLQEMSAIAADVTREREEIAALRSRVQAGLHALPEDRQTELRRLLKRKLSLDMYRYLLEQVGAEQTPVENTDTESCASDELSVSDGQNVRHYQNSNKELIDKTNVLVSPQELVQGCPEAVSLALHRLETHQDVVDHGRALAPMLGIDAELYQRAERAIGRYSASVAIWWLTQIHKRVGSTAAYFRAVTIGSKRDTFDAHKLARGLLSADNRVASRRSFDAVSDQLQRL